MAYPTEAGAPGPGGRIARVEADGPGARAGLSPGDTITRAGGAPVRDVLDWLWEADGATVALEVVGADGSSRQATLERDWDESWGLEFRGVVFDGVRECENACAFCFVAQLPPGLRPSLYVRDDDFRLSFLTGNFITLTNLSDEDMRRILEQRLSPLHVSVHAVDEDVRRSLMCPTVEDLSLVRLDDLLAGGIEVHVQIVLVPGVNDGEVLQRTLEWLAPRPGVVSVGVVPVGFTRYGKPVAHSFTDPRKARTVLEALRTWQERMRAERESTWVHAADEFYLAGGVPLPAWDEYDGFPQFENGIGMTRAFVDEIGESVAEQGAVEDDRALVTVVTGDLFAPVLARLSPSLAAFGVEARVLTVANDLLGGNVSVAGLLAGVDIAAAIANDAPGAAGPYLVPDSAVNDDGLFLDDMSVAQVRDETGADVRLVSCDAAGLASALSSIASETTG